MCDSICKTITIEESIPTFTSSFGYAIDNGLVTFQEQSYTDPVSWFWDFGDSTFSMVQQPVHQYTQPGTYTVCFKREKAK